MKIFAGLLLALPLAVGAQQGSKVCESALRAAMRDPDSMRLVHLNADPKPFEFAGADGQKYQVRGYELTVNARNGFGGYTGDQTWVCLVDAATQRQVVRLMKP